jgi:putative heme-binding domain-containing protein
MVQAIQGAKADSCASFLSRPSLIGASQARDTGWWSAGIILLLIGYQKAVPEVVVCKERSMSESDVLRLGEKVGFVVVALLLAVTPGAALAQPKAAEPLEQRLLREKPAALVKAARREGDPVRGAFLFYQPQLSCTRCHTCGDKPGASPLGPDLARPEPGTTPEAVLESVLLPSKVIRKGYELVVVTRTDGKTVTGLLAEDCKDALVLRDPAQAGKQVVVPKSDIEERSLSPISLMPAGLTSQLANRQQFLDLAAFLLESAEFGPARARSLRPDPALIDPPLPAYEADLDHAGLIAGLNPAAFARGEALYARICASCHGTKDQVGSMPTSLRFASGQFRNGSDPFRMYQTLTRGWGLMAAQASLVPRQKYDVIHYIREAYLKPHNPSQYVAVDAKYLAGLPRGTSRGPTPPDAEPWRRMDSGPTLTGTFEVGSGGGNIAYKGVAVRLDPGPGGVAKGKAWALFEHDALRMAAGWTGAGFIDWHGINFNGQHWAHPRVAGTVAFETVAGPGWADPVTGSFADPRLKGRDGKPYGPLPRTWGRYRGLYHAGDRAVLSYTIGDTSVLESPGLAGPPSDPVFTRAFEIGPRSKPMTLRVVRQGDAKAGVVPEPRGSAWVAEDGHLLLRLPAGKESLRFTVWMAHDKPAALAREAAPLDLTSLITGGRRRWDQILTSKCDRGKDDGPFAVDTLPLPVKNPWSAQMRLTGLDFLPGGTDLVVCTWDGDVWRVSGLDRADGVLTWRRIASGLFQPLGLKVAGGAIYVGCRDQIVVLRDRNGDGETDFYECFNSDHQVTESFHEFAMGLQTDAEGNFLYSKGARHAQPAVVPHHGTLLRVSKDGSRTEILATGFRAANGVCVNPDGTFFLTDQEGHWVPKNRINWVRPGKQFFGNMWGYTDVKDLSDAAQEEPICWITNFFDRSPAELVWVASKSWGGLDGALLNLSYGHGKVYVVPHERIGDPDTSPKRERGVLDTSPKRERGEIMQGGMVALPLPPFPTGVMRGRFHPGDGHLYLCGMYAWAGNQQVPGGLYRLRATGKPAYLPVGYHVTRDGLALTFSDPLHPDTAADLHNFGVKVWDLVRSERYGSDHVNERPLKVTASKLSPDRRTLTLTIPELRPTRGLELWYSVRGADGREVDGLFHGSVRRLGE